MASDGITALPNESRVLRHVPGGRHQDGKVDGSVFVPQVDGQVFQLRAKLSDGTPELGLSVASLELATGSDQERITQVRTTIPKTLKAAQRFAELTVDGAIAKVRHHLAGDADLEKLCGLSLAHTPILNEDGEMIFALHCDVLGLPPAVSTYSATVGEAISYAVTALHPAVEPSPEPDPEK